MPRYDDRHGTTRLYVGHLSSRTRSRDLEDVFSRYGRFPGFTWRVRDVDMKRDFAFVEFSDSRDADDARYSLNGRDVDGSRIVVEFAKGAPRGPGGSREFLGKGPAPGSGRCFNCGIDGHWARDCKAGDWKNKCYRCGDRGHIEKNCQNSPKKLKRARSYSRTPSPGHGRSRSRSYSRDRSYSRSRSPPKERSTERAERRSRSSRRRRSSPLPSKGRKHTLSPDEQSPRGRDTPSPENSKQGNGLDHRRQSKARSRTPIDDAERQSPRRRSPSEENGHRPSPSPREDMSPVDIDNRGSPRNSDSDGV